MDKSGNLVTSGTVTSPSVWPEMSPASHGFLAWNLPPFIPASEGAQADHTISAMKIWVPKTISVTGISLFLGSTVLSGASAGEDNGVALYDSTGLLIGKSADQAAAWGAGTYAEKRADLIGGPFTVTGGAGVYVYACFLVNATTRPSFYRYQGGINLNNVGQSTSASACTLTMGTKSSTSTWPTGANGLFTLNSSRDNYWIALY